MKEKVQITGKLGATASWKAENQILDINGK
jgi:hypothetical protein